MKRCKPFATASAVIFGAVLLTSSLEARTCFGNGDVIGSYGFTGTRSGFFLLGATPSTGGGPLIPVPVQPPGTTGVLNPVPIQPPGTTGVAIVGSNTPIGSLVAGLNNANVFSSVGRIFADGAGNLFSSTAALGSTSFATNTLVGTYTVGSDCSISVTLGDPFVTGASGTTVSAGVGTTTNGIVNVGSNSVKLEGEVIQTGNATEIVLVGANSSVAGATVRLIKTSESGSCSNASLSGNFGVVGDGVFSSTATGVTGTVTTPGTGTLPGTVTTPVTGTTPGSTGAFTNGVTGSLGTPFNLLGRFFADGSGNLVNDVQSSASTLKRNLTGTYTVNADCSGTARLADQSGVTRNIAFFLTNETAACSAGGSRQSIQFVFTDSGVIGVGTARLQ